MLTPRIFAWKFLVGLMFLEAGSALGDDFPNKPIRIITQPPGGALDFTARVIAQGTSGSLGQPVIIDNRAGIVLMELVAKSPPDGYTLLLHGSTVWITPLLQANVPYDPIRDFSPITLAANSPNVLVVHPAVPAKSVKELIAVAKTKVQALNYASAGIGGTSHLAAELFKATAGVNLVCINYKGGAGAINDLIAGQVDLMFNPPTALMPHIRTGRLRALAVTSAKPFSLLPELPTVASSGLSGYEILNLQAIFAPARTPTAIINRLNQEIVRVVNRSDVKEKLLNSGSEIVGSSPEELAAYMKSDMAKMGKVIKDAGIRDE